MSTVAHLSDFPDRLSPMVVKELRQGLRTRLFGGVMLALHALLVLITLIGGSDTDGARTRGLMDGLVSLVLYAVFPLCGLSALAREIKGGTMDMLVLTRLSAGRIVLGKWAAIVVQSLLVTVSLLPYLVARYMYGGSELFTDIISLGYQWMLSAVLTAAVVALSTQKQFWLRVLVLLVPFILSSFLPLIRLSAGFSSGMSGIGWAGPDGWTALAWIAGYIWLIFAFLSFGASRIAPAASMLPVVKRLVNLAALLILPGLLWLADLPSEAVTAVILLVMVVASVDALTDDLHTLPSHYLPFYQRSWWGRMAGWFLVPGWMHGFVYSLLIVALSTLAVAWLHHDWTKGGMVWLTGCSVWFSAWVGHLISFRRRENYLSAIFAGACVLACLTMMLFMVTGSAKNKDLESLIYVLPTSASAATSIVPWKTNFFNEGLVFNAVWPGLLAVLALRAFRLVKPARLAAREASRS